MRKQEIYVKLEDFVPALLFSELVPVLIQSINGSIEEEEEEEQYQDSDIVLVVTYKDQALLQKNLSYRELLGFELMIKR